jgi:FixJ family two-component response regulator
VIVLTGRGDDETYARARNLGVADFFTKPLERDRLIKSIERLLTSRQADPEAR